MTTETWREEDPLEGVIDAQLLVWTLRYARPHAPALAGCVLLLLILASLQLVQPYLIKIAIDDVIRPAAGGVSVPASASVAQDLVPIVGWYVAAVVGAALVQYGQLLWLRVTGQKIITEVRADVFRHLQELDLAFFDARPVGRIVTRATNDVESLNEMYTSVLVNLFRDVFFIIGAMILLFSLDWRLALVAVGVLPFVIVVSAVFRRFSREAWREMRVKLARINANLSESLSGIRVIQVFNRQDRASQEFRTVNDDYYDSAMHLIRVFAVFAPAIDLLTSAAIAGVIWYGGERFFLGAITVGTLYAFTAYVRGLFDPISALAEKYNILQSALASAERITQLLDREPTVQDAVDARVPALAQRRPEDGAAPAADVAGHGGPAVAFDRVWFAYKAEDWVLRDVSFAVQPGETVAFVGHTGAGKSTIMNLLPRFYDVQRGSVRVAGRDVRAWPQRALRRHVGIVMQEVFLFAGDVAFNIALDDPRIDRARVEAAGSIVGADPFVRRLPGGYDEPVVERGMSLSAGQRQLISFARALAHDPAVLILDEATASIDTETELALQEAMRTLARDRTTMIVAHRLSTIQDADRIYVMDHGRIVEQGSHAELLEADGIYRRLWELQVGR